MLNTEIDIITRIQNLENQVKALQLSNQTEQIILSDGTNPRVFIDGLTGTMKVSRVGFDVTTCPNADLVFHSNYSMFREVQMQVMPQDRYTNNTSWVEL